MEYHVEVALIHTLCFTFKTLLSKLFFCKLLYSRGKFIIISQWIKNGEGVKMTDTAKVKKGKVGGDDVGSEDTEGLEPDNEQW